MSSETLPPTSQHYDWLQAVLSGMKLFSKFPVKNLLPAVRLQAYPSGAAVFKQGEKGDAMYIIYKGRVSIQKKKGFFWSFKEIARLGSGQVFGEMALLDYSPRAATAKALEDSEIFMLSSADFDSLIAKNPTLAEHLGNMANRRKFDLFRD